MILKIFEDTYRYLLLGSCRHIYVQLPGYTHRQLATGARKRAIGRSELMGGSPMRMQNDWRGSPMIYQISLFSFGWFRVHYRKEIHLVDEVSWSVMKCPRCLSKPWAHVAGSGESWLMGETGPDAQRELLVFAANAAVSVWACGWTPWNPWSPSWNWSCNL